MSHINMMVLTNISNTDFDATLLPCDKLGGKELRLVSKKSLILEINIGRFVFTNIILKKGYKLHYSEGLHTLAVMDSMGNVIKLNKTDYIYSDKHYIISWDRYYKNDPFTINPILIYKDGRGSDLKLIDFYFNKNDKVRHCSYALSNSIPVMRNLESPTIQLLKYAREKYCATGASFKEKAGAVVLTFYVRGKKAINLSIIRETPGTVSFSWDPEPKEKEFLSLLSNEVAYQWRYLVGTNLSEVDVLKKLGIAR